MIDRLGRHVHSPFLHAAVAAAFVLINLVGYAFLGGRDFVEGWGGGLAAVIATGFLVWKSQGYWAWRRRGWSFYRLKPGLANGGYGMRSPRAM